MLDIRNQTDIRNISLNQDYIILQKHLLWVKNLKNDDTKEYFAVIYDGEIIGGVNVFDIDKDITWGIFFKDTAPLMIKSFIPIYFIEFVYMKFKHKDIYAKIKQDNINAISFNKNLGFEILKTNNSIVTMILKYNNFLKSKDSFVLKKIIKKMQGYSIELFH